MNDSAGSAPVVKLSDDTEVPQDLYDSMRKRLFQLKMEQPSMFRALILCANSPFAELKPAGQTRRTMASYQLVDAQTGVLLPVVVSMVRHMTVCAVDVELRPEVR